MDCLRVCERERERESDDSEECVVIRLSVNPIFKYIIEYNNHG